MFLSFHRLLEEYEDLIAQHLLARGHIMIALNKHNSKQQNIVIDNIIYSEYLQISETIFTR